MIMDSRNEFADAVALNTGAAGTYLIGSQIDLTAGLAIGNNVTAYPGNSDGLYLVVTCDTTLTGATATLQIKLVSDDSAAISTTTSTVHYVSPVHTVGGAGVTAGGVICVVELPRGDYERYLGILQVTGVTNITAGKINAFLTMNPKTFSPIAAPDAI
jgi:hypothetical protein